MDDKFATHSLVAQWLLHKWLPEKPFFSIATAAKALLNHEPFPLWTKLTGNFTHLPRFYQSSLLSLWALSASLVASWTFEEDTKYTIFKEKVQRANRGKCLLASFPSISRCWVLSLFKRTAKFTPQNPRPQGGPLTLTLNTNCSVKRTAPALGFWFGRQLCFQTI
jgi:hypothetical protein